MFTTEQTTARPCDGFNPGIFGALILRRRYKADRSGFRRDVDHPLKLDPGTPWTPLLSKACPATC
jgi:hypothetical protein